MEILELKHTINEIKKLSGWAPQQNEEDRKKESVKIYC